MESYYFKKYKEEWYKEKLTNCRKPWNILWWILFILFFLSGFMSAISIFLGVNFVLFGVFVLLTIIFASMVSIYGDKLMAKYAFVSYADYKDYCENLIKHFDETFKVRKAEHFKVILDHVNAESDLLYNDLNKPFKSTVSFTTTLLIAFIPLLWSYGQLPETLQKYAPILLCILILICLAILSATYFYSQSMNRTLRLYREFADDIQEIINIKNGFYENDDQTK